MVRAIDRDDHLGRLREEAFDLLIIGGGITGATAARDAARRGYRTALIEARDFAEGTSSRSSRLIHGGLRYLEHFEFDLVFEGSQERRRLLQIAPHHVHPLEFLFPIYQDGRVGRIKLDAGMWLYDALSLFRNIERHQMLSEEELLEKEPGLRAEGLLGGARYFDAQVDDARLVLSNVIAATEAGAAVANRLEVQEVDTRDWPGHSVRVLDRESGGEWSVDALVVLNATGPWTDRTAALAGVKDDPLLQPTRGTHIHVPRSRVGHEHAFIFESPVDRRVMFVLPWRELTLIGTTDDFHDGPPQDVAPTAEDVRYLLESTNHLFPDAELVESDVLSAWAGLRPLVVQSRGSEDGAEGEVSRDFVVRQEPIGFFTIAGGKLTSSRAMAEQAVDQIGEFLAEADVTGERKCDTARVPLPGGDFDDLEALCEHVSTRAADLGLDLAATYRLVRAYGTRADDVLDLVRERRELAAPLLEGLPYVAADVVYAARCELALHLEDVVYRRTHLAMETHSRFRRACERTAGFMAEELGWSDGRMVSEIERAESLYARDDAWRADMNRAGNGE